MLQHRPGGLLLGMCAALALPASAEVPTGPIVSVEFVVEDPGGRPVRDLRRDEAVVHQDGVLQQVREFVAGPDAGQYRLSYAPSSGAAGAVSMRLLRRGARARGPDGPALKVRVAAPLRPFEVPLVEALDSEKQAGTIVLRSVLLRFEPADNGRHHTLAVEVPLRGIRTEVAAGVCRARLGFLARLREAGGRVIERTSLEYPIESPGTDCRILETQEVVWTSHFHLKPGRYDVEVAAHDAMGGQVGVERRALEVASPTPGLQMSSVTILHAGQSLSAEQASSDNPLEHLGQRFVPAQRAAFVEGSAMRLYFFVVLYPDGTAAPLELSLEIHRGGELLGRGRIVLPERQEAAAAVPYVGFIEVQQRKLGSHELRLVGRQGETRVTESAPFDIASPPRFGAAP